MTWPSSARASCSIAVPAAGAPYVVSIVLMASPPGPRSDGEDDDGEPEQCVTRCLESRVIGVHWRISFEPCGCDRQGCAFRPPVAPVRDPGLRTLVANLPGRA